METYANLSNIAADPNFQQRVRFALLSASVAIYNESAGVTNHALRAAYARNVTSGGFNLLMVCLAVLSTATVEAEASFASSPNFGIADTDIQNAVNSIFNVLAGA